MGRIMSTVVAAGLLVIQPTTVRAQEPPVTTTTTPATIGGESSDDFLTLYPQYDPTVRDYLAPGTTPLPTTGTSPEVAIAALALVATGLLTRRQSRPSPRRR